MDWLIEYATLYGDRIVKNKMGNDRIVSMTGLPLTHAKALAAYCRRKVVPDPPLPDPADYEHQAAPEEVESDPQDIQFEGDKDRLFFNKAYIYNKETDTYVTFLPDLPKPLVLPGDVHREIVRSYSNFDGSPASVNEIARSVKMPRPWVVKYLRAHGITHDREPFTPEEVLTRSDDDLVEDALQLRRAAVYKKLEAAKWDDIQKDAMKWRSFKDHTLRAITTALQGHVPPTPKPLRIQQAKAPYAAVVGLTDFHWGKYSDQEENGEHYSRTEARRRLYRCTEDVFSRVLQFGAPEKIYVPIGSDFLQIDNDLGTTTRGTVQDTDGTPAEILVSACRLMEEWIQTLRQIAPVELVLMSGNHDRMMGLSILLYLEALYRRAEGVTVHLRWNPRQYRTYGKNLLGFVHGDGVSKTTDLAGHMAREAASAWGICPHRTIYTGHLHNERTETDTSFGVTRRQLPSLSGPDRWHNLSGYVGAPKSLPVYLHDRNRGLVAVIYSPT